MKIRIVLMLTLFAFVVTPVMADPPPVAGVVIRGETTIGYGYADVKRGYIVFLGIDLFAICQANPNPEFSIWDFQVVDPPPDDILHEMLKGDVVTGVWGIEAMYDPCSYLPIAVGRSHVVSNLRGHNVANLSAHGVLTDPLDGEQMIFSTNLHCVTDGYGTCIDDYHAKIVLN